MGLNEWKDGTQLLTICIFYNFQRDKFFLIPKLPRWRLYLFLTSCRFENRDKINTGRESLTCSEPLLGWIYWVGINFERWKIKQNLRYWQNKSDIWFFRRSKDKKRGWPDEDDFSWNQILFELHIDYKIALEILDCQSYDQYIINSSNPISLKIFIVWKSDCDSAIKFILSAW